MDRMRLRLSCIAAGRRSKLVVVRPIEGSRHRQVQQLRRGALLLFSSPRVASASLRIVRVPPEHTYLTPPEMQDYMYARWLNSKYPSGPLGNAGIHIPDSWTKSIPRILLRNAGVHIYPMARLKVIGGSHCEWWEYIYFRRLDSKYPARLAHTSRRRPCMKDHET